MLCGLLTYRPMSTNDELNRPPSAPQYSAGRPGAYPPQGPEPPVEQSDMFDEFEAEEEEPQTRWHAGLDLGLLILRIAVGGTMLLRGLHRFGLFGGQGMSSVADGLENLGFTTQPTLLAWVLSVTEVGAGGLLVLGFFTPLMAAAILSITATHAYLDRTVGYFSEAAAGDAQIPGYAFPLMVGAGAVALLFTGPGRAAIDVATPWRKKPLPFGLVALLLAAAAAVAVLWLFR